MVLWQNGIFSSSAQKHAILRHFLAPKPLLTHFFGILEVFYANLPCLYRFFSTIVLKPACKWAKTIKNWHQPPPPGGYCQLFPIDRRNRAPEVSLEYIRLFGSDMDQISRGLGILERDNALAQDIYCVTSRPKARDGHRYPSPALVFRNGSSYVSRAAAPKETGGD